MTSTLEQSGANLRKIKIEIPQSDFQEALKKSYQKNKNRFQVPGFRKGKAPMPIVSNYYGEAVLYDDAIDILIDPAYREALKEHEIEAFSHPEVSIDAIGSDKGLSFTVEVAVRPDVKLGDPSQVEAYRPAAVVEDKDVEERIERDRLRVSRLVPVDRPVQKDDTVTIDYEGRVDGVAFDGGKAENYDLKIGSNSFIPGFEDALIGHSKGETFTIQLRFPDDYHSEELKGKDTEFTVCIHEIREREMPELDDEFVKDISEDLDTVDQYRQSIREELEKQAGERAENEFQQRALEAYVKLAEMELPELAIQDEVDHMVQEQRQQMMYQGFQLEQYLQMLGISEAAFRMQLRASAEQSLKERLTLDALAKEQGFEVSDEAFEKRLKEIAELYQMDFEKVKERFSGEEAAPIKENMLREEAIKYLASKAKATDTLPEEKKAEEDEEKAEEDGEKTGDQASE